jgi:nitrogen fixation protein FixH
VSLIRKEHIWPTIVVCMLGAYVTFGVVAARIASHDPNYAIEPDYYRKAVTWDSTMAQRRENVALGWQVTPSLGPVGGTRTAFALELRDAGGERVNGAQVSVEARQVAHAEDVVRATLRADSTGVYVARMPIVRAGLWEMRVVAARGVERFATSVRLDASSSSAAMVVDARPGDALAARVNAGTRLTP